MKDLPILFSGVMIRALLAGRKTNSRRMSEQWMKVKAGDRLWVRETWGIGGARLVDPCLNYRAGGQIPIHRDREAHGSIWEGPGGPLTGEELLRVREGWIPSIHMYRWASRITLEATEDARREPLADISKADAMAEGIQVLPLQSADDPSAWYQSAPGENQRRTAQSSFFALWNSINGKKYPVSSNPVPVRLAFRVVA